LREDYSAPPPGLQPLLLISRVFSPLLGLW